jgi:hypothetical protein
MVMETERIERKGFLGYGFSSYVQEIKKPKISTEKVRLDTENAVEMFDENTGRKINILA